MNKVCAVNDGECIDGRLKRGLCEKHYRRQLKHGSTESRRIDNLSQYVVTDEGCWMWAGARYTNGYGKTSTSINSTRLAHRAFYLEYVGPVDGGLDLDHICRNRWCVNPNHLEPVTRSQNLRRGAGSYGARSVCRRGLHNISDPENVYVSNNGVRQCKPCWRESYRKSGTKYRAKLREAA